MLSRMAPLAVRIALAVSIVLAGASQAATIDDFTTPQSLAAGTGTGLATSGVATGSSSLGGARAVVLTRDESAAGTDAVEIGPTSGALLTTDCCSGAYWTFIYDGGLDANYDPQGLGGLNLSRAAAIVIRLKTDFLVDLRILVTTSSTAQSFRTGFGYPSADGFIDVVFPLDTFLLAPGATVGADYAHVGALVFGFNLFPEYANDAASVRILSITTIPEPPTGPTLLAALCLLGAAASRSKRSSRVPVRQGR